MPMRTSMNIPKDLLSEAVKLTGVKTQTSAVILSLQEMIRRKKLERLFSLQGKGVLGLKKNDLKRMRQR